MLRKLLFTLIWAFAFFNGSFALLCLGFLAAGLYSRLTDGPTAITFSRLWEFTPILGAAIGCLLGLLGRLPGTRSPPRASGDEPGS